MAHDIILKQAYFVLKKFNLIALPLAKEIFFLYLIICEYDFAGFIRACFNRIVQVFDKIMESFQVSTLWII